MHSQMYGKFCNFHKSVHVADFVTSFKSYNIAVRCFRQVRYNNLRYRRKEYLTHKSDMRTIRYHVELKAADDPDKVFMFCQEAGLQMTFAQLKRGCLELAGFFHDRGFAKNDKISFMAELLSLMKNSSKSQLFSDTILPPLP